MKVQSEKDYVNDHVKLAEGSLKDLAILRHDQWAGRGGIITVGNPNGSSVYRCDIMLSPAGYLILTGDLDTVVWGGYCGDTVAGAVEWMARSDVSYYVHQKANIGMGNVGCDDFDEGVAVWEAKDYLRDAIEGDCISRKDWEEVVENLTDPNVGTWDAHSVGEMIYGIMNDPECTSIGNVASQRLLWGWSVMRKTNELLQAQPELYYLQDNRQIVGNCALWWAKKDNGYTCEIRKAETYTKEEALSRCRKGVEKAYLKRDIDALTVTHVRQEPLYDLVALEK